MSSETDPRDPVLDETVVLGLARRHWPAADRVTAVDESGGEARAYAIDDDVILKTQRPHRVRPRTSLEKEVFHLEQLASQAPEISVPRVLGYGCDSGVEYTVMTRMPGRAMLHVRPRGEARSAVLRELGSVLRRIHELDVQPFRASGLFPGDADSAAVQARLDADLDGAVHAASQLRPEWTLNVSPAGAADQVREDLRVTDARVVALHSNPGPEHVFVDPQTLRLSGLIDFGDAYLSYPALDLRRWAHPSDRQGLFAGYAGEHPPGEAFMRVWRGISVIALMLDFAQRPSRRAESLDGLDSLLRIKS